MRSRLPVSVSANRLPSASFDGELTAAKHFGSDRKNRSPTGVRSAGDSTELSEPRRQSGPLRLSLSATKIAPLPTSHLGPYELLELLGAGGMGEVYRARDTRLDRIVAIKILPSSAADDPEARQRFEREARTISQINHPHICTLHDVGRQEGIDYLVFEYLEGETLARRLSKGPLPIHEALAVAIQVADALDSAHRAGIVHRDLKPGNIMLVGAGRRGGSSIARHPRDAATAAGQPLANLLDFGIAKPRAAVTGFSSSGSGSAIPGDVQPTLGAPLTAQGAILGTVQYMAPELIEGHDAGPLTDIWAFGCILYEMLSGEPPFDRKTRARADSRHTRTRAEASSRSAAVAAATTVGNHSCLPRERPCQSLAISEGPCT
jgi:serine/threonine protein kinase